MLPFIYTFYRFWRSVKSAIKDPEFEVLFTLLSILLILGTFFYHGVEGWNYVDSMYFSVVTLTTVGYGDIAPQTDAGKLFTILYLLVGIGVLLGFVNTIAHHAIQESRDGTLISHRLGLRKRRHIQE